MWHGATLYFSQGTEAQIILKCPLGHRVKSKSSISLSYVGLYLIYQDSSPHVPFRSRPSHSSPFLRIVPKSAFCMSSVFRRRTFARVMGTGRHPLSIKKCWAPIALGKSRLHSRASSSLSLSRSPSKTSKEAISLFADTISSIEFYLETLKYTVKPNPKILKFAAKSAIKLNLLMITNKKQQKVIK